MDAGIAPSVPWYFDKWDTFPVRIHWWALQSWATVTDQVLDFQQDRSKEADLMISFWWEMRAMNSSFWTGWILILSLYSKVVKMATMVDILYLLYMHNKSHYLWNQKPNLKYLMMIADILVSSIGIKSLYMKIKLKQKK